MSVFHKNFGTNFYANVGIELVFRFVLVVLTLNCKMNLWCQVCPWLSKISFTFFITCSLNGIHFKNGIINLLMSILIKSFLAHLTQRVMWAIVTTERPSVNFSHFNQLLWSHWANFNQTLVEWSLDGPFQNYVRWSRLPTKLAAKL